MTITTKIFILLMTLLLVAACSKSPFTDTDGNDVQFSSKEGKWLALNFWAEWCDPCRDEIPELNAMADAGTVRVVGVDFDGSTGDELRQKVKELGITFPVIRQSPLDALQAKAPQVLPATYLINPEGKVAETLFGPQTKYSLERQIKTLQEKKVDG